ncbi:MAG: hypothetical protein GY855_16195, partial [candidate division Zixibacteria bacterium]|nr:hypothetical protein [candidate division Zixibacteria bacterium]
MRYSVNTLLIGLFVSVLMILFMFPVCSQSEETTGTVKITISSDDIRIYISDADNGDVHYTFSLEDIQYHYGEVRLHDNIVFNESGIVINGKRFPRDRLTSVTIEKNAGVLWNLIVNSDTDKLGDGVKKIKYSKSENDRWEFYDDLIIDNGEIIRGNVVNLFGDIEVYGWVEGDVVSIFGDVFIDSTGTTAKDVIAVNGDIITAPGAEIYGRQRTGTFGDDKESSKFYFGDRKKGYLSSDVKYNRVAGLDLAAETGFKDIKHELPEFYINGGYAFKLKRWHYDFGFRQQLLDRFAIIFGGNFYQLIDNNDEWVIKSEENSLAAFFIKEDFHDFFQREGYSAFVEQWLGYNNRFRFGYSVDSYELLEKHTNWSIFGTKKDFRENYSFVLPDSTGLREFNGDMKSIAINYELDTRERLYESVAGWYALLEWERAGYGLGGEFEFDRYWCIA